MLKLMLRRGVVVCIQVKKRDLLRSPRGQGVLDAARIDDDLAAGIFRFDEVGLELGKEVFRYPISPGKPRARHQQLVDVLRKAVERVEKHDLTIGLMEPHQGVQDHSDRAALVSATFYNGARHISTDHVAYG